MNIRVKFYWYISDAYNDGILRPACTVINDIGDCKIGVCSLLDDDGGLGVGYLVQHAQEYITAIESVRAGASQHIDCFGQAWGAEISTEYANIYWGYDEIEQFEKIRCKDFENILRAWLQHLKSAPSLDVNREYELSVIPPEMSLSHMCS